MNKITLSLVCFAGIAFVVIVTALTISQPQFRVALSGTDFRGQYTGALMVNRGVTDNLYNIMEQFRWQKGFLPELMPGSLMVFSYHPLVAVLLSPLGLLSFGHAYRFALAVNIGLLLYTIRINAHLLTINHTKNTVSALYAIYAFYLPVWFAVLQNQFSFLLYVLFYYLWKCIKEKRYVCAGLLLSALLIKPHMLVVPLLVFALVRNGKIVKWFTIGFTAVFLTTIGLLGTKILANYFSFLVLLSKAGDSYTIHTSDEPTVKGVMHLLLQTDKLPPVATAVYAVIFFASVIRLVYVKKLVNKKNNTFDLWYGNVILATLLTSPHTNYHDLFLVLLPVIMLLRYSLTKPHSEKLAEFPIQKKLTWYTLCFGVFVLTTLWVFYPPVAAASMLGLFVVTDFIIRRGHLYAFTKRSILARK